MTTVPSNVYDCIVVGLGAHGSCSCARLAKNGASVLGLEQFEDVTHSNGSSHGKSRIIRTAYFESPKYVPLVRRSLELWKESQREYIDLSGCVDPNPLLVLSGCLIIGKKSTEIVKGTLRSAREHNLTYEVLSASEIRRRFEGVFNVGVEDIGVFERDCGFLVPESCIAAHIRIAQEHGCTTKYGERMLSWEESLGEDGSPVITVTTNKNQYRAQKLVLSVGAWAPEIYGQRIADRMRLQCERRILWWVDPLRSPVMRESTTADGIAVGKESKSDVLTTKADSALSIWIRHVWRWSHSLFSGWWGWLFASKSLAVAAGTVVNPPPSEVPSERALKLIETCKHLPVYIWDTGTGSNFYGFPFIQGIDAATAACNQKGPVANFSGTGMKMAMHLSPAKEDVRCERSTIDRCVSSRDEANMRELVSVHMPLFNGPVVSTATCMYTSTEDGHFLVDWLPSSTGGPSNVLLCSPCSGHGFKMATVIGEIVQQLIQTGKTEHDISLFKLETR